MNINALNQLYKSKEGDRLAREELLPVVQRYLARTSQPKILEIGCGYGRNTVALSEITNGEIYGCDISEEELDKARTRLEKNKKMNVKLVHQKDERTLPFQNDTFDFVVCWQVLEHILLRDTKRCIIEEMTRVLKDGGYLLIETPNFWFPIDYHDNRLPFVHWVLPSRLRYLITKRIRDEDFPPSQYTSICELRRFLTRSPFVRSFKQKTKIYFEKRYMDVFRHLGGTNIGFKKVFFTVYFPIYFVLSLLRISGDLLTPSLRVVFQIRKS